MTAYFETGIHQVAHAGRELKSSWLSLSSAVITGYNIISINVFWANYYLLIFVVFLRRGCMHPRLTSGLIVFLSPPSVCNTTSVLYSAGEATQGFSFSLSYISSSKQNKTKMYVPPITSGLVICLYRLNHPFSNNHHISGEPEQIIRSLQDKSFWIRVECTSNFVLLRTYL